MFEKWQDSPTALAVLISVFSSFKYGKNFSFQNMISHVTSINKYFYVNLVSACKANGLYNGDGQQNTNSLSVSLVIGVIFLIQSLF
jgi:hypothetical protein